MARWCTDCDRPVEGETCEVCGREVADAADAEPTPLAGGESAAALLPELTAPNALLHDRAGCVPRHAASLKCA